MKKHKLSILLLLSYHFLIFSSQKSISNFSPQEQNDLIKALKKMSLSSHKNTKKQGNTLLNLVIKLDENKIHLDSIIENELIKQKKFEKEPTLKKSQSDKFIFKRNL